MPKQIIIAEQHRLAAVFEEDQIQELVVATGSHQVGDIYLGSVENVLPGIDAAFVNIGDAQRNGFIHVTDLGPLRLKRGSGTITELLVPQQKVLVQVMKEPTGSKGPRLTGNITMPGRYLVLMPYGRGVNLSRRIMGSQERSRLRALAILIKPTGMGLLVRTEAQSMAEEAIMEDLEELLGRWESILAEASSASPPALLGRDDDFIVRVLRDMYSNDVNRIVVDSHTGLKRVKQQIMNWNGGKTPPGILIDHHREKTSILEYFRVNAAIREALKPRVDLPSGGYVIIEPTEALTVIDVNSGSFTSSATARETVLWTNCEAATEIARQLRLRNIAGVIIVDFIDMDSRKDQLRVLQHFEEALLADKARPQVAQLSELGLVELTRKRQGQNIYELFGHTCKTCNGLGHLAALPGEVEDPPAALQDRSYPVGRETPTPDLRSSETPAPTLKPDFANEFDSNAEAGSGYGEPSALGSPSGMENLGEGFSADDEAIARRTRRRRPDAKDQAGYGYSEPAYGSGSDFSATTLHEGSRTSDVRFSSRKDYWDKPTNPRKRIGGRAIEAPPEVVKVPMTAEEQDIYALMGISPLVLLPNGESKNPKATIIEVNSVDSHDSEGGSTATLVSPPPETQEEASPDPETVAQEEGSWGWMSPTRSQEYLSTQISQQEESDRGSVSEDETGEEIPETRRRRRRRSSADSD
ncbi:Rne/Rng family ribonuclease [Roseofilum sp. BLCC_M91]|uniref:Rne/Rng family ribonuclease n=1 Tax=Roseofilum halophilum BLCC-M91 TaxID=3022259 RepID=A0ABT7BH67_9CYAN|nr:Rne/Rng family ribonuclease [Roseofilum halophilum]MDJ1178529.1 Rne/Rng family ribonuclease [Roseofilum halophilum BLCC-M91]